ncbi:hypothetical protein [Pedobacter sp. MC2016-24]|uniref:hypothetical protein n=1 Tax=Pedobacter sp. MC2016-24 TaxID=2780090 RepID=UPI0018822B5F|nr:hypothetical protein [Pedobacter sp. MC2016-24]MBE9599507.1 hypothetical protein [Pedobacter sp. MC2016-24]
MNVCYKLNGKRTNSLKAVSSPLQQKPSCEGFLSPSLLSEGKQVFGHPKTQLAGIKTK